VEFRHLGGTSNVAKILRWINLVLKIRKYAETHPWRMLKFHIDRLNTSSSYMAFVQDVFGECAGYLDCSSLKEDMEAQVSAVKAIQLEESAFWKEIKEKDYRGSEWYLKLIYPGQLAPAKGGMAIPRDVPVPRPRRPRQEEDIEAAPQRDPWRVPLGANVNVQGIARGLRRPA
jgi:hypothetical protein